MIDSNFASRLDSLLTFYNKIVCKESGKVFTFSEWGMVEDTEKHMEKLEDMQILSLYLLMLEWKAYEQNTFYLELDDDDCPTNIQYPSTVVEIPECEDDMNLIDCICRYFHCKHHMDIEPLLKVMGAFPVGEVPDGVSFMYIKEDDCSNNIFEVNKP